MPETEELRLVVTLDDQASAKLANLQNQLKSGSSGGFLGTMAQQSEAAAKSTKNLQGELGALASRAGFIGGVVGGITGELTKMGLQLISRATDVNKLAAELNNLSTASYRMGTSSAQLVSNLRQFREVGVSFESATKQLANFTDQMTDLSLVNGQLRGQLLSGAFLEIPKMMEHLQRIDSARTIEEKAKAYSQLGRAVREFNAARGGEAFGAKRERDLLGLAGAPDLDQMVAGFTRVTAAERELGELRDRNAAERVKETARVQTGYDKIIESTGGLLLLTDQVTGATKKWADMVNAAADEYARFEHLLSVPREQADRMLRERKDEYLRTLTPKGEALTKGAFGQEPESEGQARFNSLMNRLMRSFFPSSEGAIPQKFIGGSVQGGDWDSSNFTKSGGNFWKGLGGRNDVDIEDRRNLEDNTGQTKELTEQIKVLNDTLTLPQMPGRAPAGSLSAALGYNQLGGGGGGGGGGDWGGGGGGGGGGATMANRGAFAPGGGGNDMPVTGAVGAPSAILAKAQEVALQGGPGAVGAFMASQGYPKAGAWCGEFAASVVKAAGGTPPANPAVASNWRKWGTQVDMPQPGDIAVKIGSRFGGRTATGATGSHVTFVNAVGAGGTFQGLGGNQGSILSNFPTSGYQFFRGSGAEAQSGAGGGATTGAGGDTAGLSQSAFMQMFKGTKMEGQYGAVVAAAQRHGVSPALVAGIIAHESGRGTSRFIREMNNPAGLMDPATGMARGQSFGDLGSGIDASARIIAKNLARGGGTIAGMQHFYAPVGAANDPRSLNSGWTSGVTGYVNQLRGGGGALASAGGGRGDADSNRRMGFVYDPDTGAPLRNYDPYTGAKLGGGGGVAPAIQAAQMARAAAQASADVVRERQLRQEISAAEVAGLGRQRRHGEAAPEGGARPLGFEGEPIRVHPRDRGVGGEAAPMGGAPMPRGLRGRVRPRTPGVGGEAAPLGGMPEPADVKQRRLQDEQERRLTELHEIEQRKIDVTEQQRTKELNDRVKDYSRRVGRAAETPDERDTRLKEAADRESRGREARRTGALMRGEDPDDAERAFQRNKLERDREVTVTGKGQLNVNIKGPPGTRASGSGSGLLKNTKVQQETQMAPASKAAADAEAEAFPG